MLDCPRTVLVDDDINTVIEGAEHAGWEDEILEWACDVANGNVEFAMNNEVANGNAEMEDDNVELAVNNVDAEAHEYEVNNGFDDVELDLHAREYNYSNIDSTYAPSDDLQSLNNSSEDEDDDGGLHAPRSVITSLEVGKKYESAAKFREDLRAHSFSDKYDFRFVKNEGNRVTAVCSSSCGWRIHASSNNVDGSFQIKTLNPTHCCTWKKISRQASAGMLANKYMETLRDEPKWKTSAMKKAALRDLDVFVTKSKVYRAKKMALKEIDGDHGMQFSRARDYCHLIQKTNPGSIAVTSVNRPTLDHPARFEGLFICFEAMKKGFLEGCRPFIGLDGCFLKGPYKGQLLSAIGRDGDNGIFPIAIAVVRAETKESWKWFMDQLQSALGPLHRFTFMSDRQKGLVETFEDMLYGADHRYCVKHMYENFKKKFKGVKLRNEMWNAARALTTNAFEYHMQIIKKIDKDAYEWLANVPPRLWSRSKFNDNSKCDLVVNNMCETWNDNIREARDKPLITMLEWIRGYLMYRFQSKREWIHKKNGLLCPNIADELQKKMDDSRHCSTKKSSPHIYEVSYKGVNEGVNLEARTCSCREWDVKGIPCIHAIACIVSERGKSEEYVDSCYHRETYLRTYMPIIFPMPLRHLEREVGTDPIHPPIVRATTGRPKNSRRKAVDEVSKPGVLSRKRSHIRCGRCGEMNHNTRTCKATEVTPKPRGQVRGQGGRPRLPVTSGLPGGLPNIDGSAAIRRGDGRVVSGRGRVDGRAARGRENGRQLQEVITIPSRYGNMLNNLSGSSSVDLNVLWSSTQASSSSRPIT